MACYPIRPGGRVTTRRGPPAWPGPPQKTCAAASTSPISSGPARPHSAACSSGCSGHPWQQAGRARPGRAPGPGHLPGGGADRRGTRSHDPPPGPQCPACAGSGSRPGTTPRRCPGCGGTGQRAVASRHGPLLVRQVITCPQCAGRDGSSICPARPVRPADAACGRRRSPFASRPASRREPCCGWPGAECRVPCPAARRATRTRASGPATTPGSPGPAPICGTTCTFRHPTPRSASPRPCPYSRGRRGSGCHREPQPGSVLRVEGRGLPRYGGHGRGSLNLTVILDIPRRLSARQRQLYEQLRAEDAGEQARRADPASRTRPDPSADNGHAGRRHAAGRGLIAFAPVLLLVTGAVNLSTASPRSPARTFSSPTPTTCPAACTPGAGS